jgi:DNA recombination protein RmuC
MNWEWTAAVLLVGLVFGWFVATLARIRKSSSAKDVAYEIFRENEQQRKAQMDALLQGMRESFTSLSMDALSKSTDEFLKLAKSKLESERELSSLELDSRKQLIDRQLERMNAELDKVSRVMTDLEKDRIDKFGQLVHHLRLAGEQTVALMQTTQSLREALASSKVRGQWGERMAEDVLRIAGFIENINYLKQTSIESGSTRPDFTFLLPKNLKLNMDVKFPLDNYLKYLQAESDGDRMKFRDLFFRNVKDKLKEVTTRNYINADDNTVDYVLLFIPNEHIYAFIHDQEGSLLDEGIKNKVIFCSPITLFAVLAVIRQAVDNFALETTSKEILSLFGAFKEQWIRFTDHLEKLGKRIGDAQKDYESLVTTRRRQLERPLNRIDSLRIQQGLPAAIDSDSGIGTAEDSDQ